MVTFNQLLKPHMTESQVLSMVAQSSEFDNIMVREVSGAEWCHDLMRMCYHSTVASIKVTPLYDSVHMNYTFREFEKMFESEPCCPALL